MDNEPGNDLNGPGRRVVDRLAVLAYILPLLAVCLAPVCILQAYGEGRPAHAPWSLILLALAPYACALAGSLLGVFLLIRIRRNKKLSGGRNYAVASIILGLLATATLGLEYTGFEWIIAAESAADPTQCASNLYQLGRAVRVYAEDRDGYFPNPAYWNQKITPYTKNDGVFICPLASDGTLPSYAMNSRLRGLRVKDIASPGETVMFFESVPGKNRFGGPELFEREGRHGGGYNVVFVDGHVRWSSEDTFRSLNFDPNKKPTQP